MLLPLTPVNNFAGAGEDDDVVQWGRVQWKDAGTGFWQCPSHDASKIDYRPTDTYDLRLDSNKINAQLEVCIAIATSVKTLYSAVKSAYAGIR